jgi:hypothetical protein
MARITLSCDMVPTLIWARKRSWPKRSCWNRIFSATHEWVPAPAVPVA